MHQRKFENGRPSGTDGSDFSYRMVVDSRYQKVAECKSRLSVFILVQEEEFVVIAEEPWEYDNGDMNGSESRTIIQLIAAGNLFLSTQKAEDLDRLAVSSSIIYFISLLVGELGRKRSRMNLLKFYVFGSSLALLSSVASLSRSHYVLQVIQDFSHWDTSIFELIKSAAVLLGLGVQIFAIGTTASLIRNMAPPKRTS